MICAVFVVALVAQSFTYAPRADANPPQPGDAELRQAKAQERQADALEKILQELKKEKPCTCKVK
jgi:hypothetical protein